MTDLRADMKKAVEFGVARFAPIWQRDWEKIMAESRRMTDRELMQQALDLLNDINQCSLPPTGIPLPAEIDHVMEALQDRLEQPEREWQGLTDEEIEDVCWTEVDQRLRSFARAIEAKLKEKNIG